MLPDWSLGHYSDGPVKMQIRMYLCSSDWMGQVAASPLAEAQPQELLTRGLSWQEPSAGRQLSPWLSLTCVRLRGLCKQWLDSGYEFGPVSHGGPSWQVYPYGSTISGGCQHLAGGGSCNCRGHCCEARESSEEAEEEERKRKGKNGGDSGWGDHVHSKRAAGKRNGIKTFKGADNSL